MLDGNCFFESVALFLNSHKSHSWDASQLRQLAVQNLTNLTMKRKAELENYLETTLDDYIEKIKKEVTYADQIAIRALSDSLQISLSVIDEDNEIVFNEEYPGRCYVGYLKCISHYVSIKRTIKVEVQKYFAVDFVDKFFIGLAVDEISCGIWRMKYLHQSELRGHEYFYWPVVRKNSILYSHKAL